MFPVSGLIGGLLSGPGKWLLIGAAFLAWTGYIRHDAAVKARAECRADQLQATIDEMNRQQDVAEAALKRAQERADAAALELSDLEKEHAQIKIELGKAGEGACRIPRDVTKRLRGIR